jgi:hypothetical protein
MAGLHLTLLGDKGGTGNCNELKTLCRHKLEKYRFSTKDNWEHTCEAHDPALCRTWHESDMNRSNRLRARKKIPAAAGM